MFNNYVKPVRDLRNNYSEIAELVKDHNQVIITNNGKSESVLLSYEDYQSYEDYLHQKFVENKLAEASEMASKKDAKWYTLDEAFEAIFDEYGYENTMNYS